MDNFTRVGDANWIATDGALQATQGGKDPAYLVTKQSYTNFTMRVEFWASDDANSGVFMRCQDRSTITDENCYEANIFDQRPDPTYGTGAIVKVAAVSPMPKAGGKWNTYEITARGSQLIARPERRQDGRRPAMPSSPAARSRCSGGAERSSSARSRSGRSESARGGRYAGRLTMALAMTTLEPQSIDPATRDGAGRRHHRDADHRPPQEGAAQRLDPRRAAGRPSACRRAASAAPSRCASCRRARTSRRRRRGPRRSRPGRRSRRCRPARSPSSTRWATTDAGIFGDILCARMAKRGVAALVTDGVVRDLAGVLGTGLPVWCRGTAAPASVERPDLRRLAGADRLRRRRRHARTT